MFIWSIFLCIGTQQFVKKIKLNAILLRGDPIEIFIKFCELNFSYACYLSFIS